MARYTLMNKNTPVLVFDYDPKSWGDINFFDNDFSDDLGFLTLGQGERQVTGSLSA